ncbi:MAG: transcription initiation protein [Ferruginibacter sp.]|uniref:YciI family protein n=1 Tax=Ferruginibacter sp. TaxID=1940288 RepID=UPI0026590A94|nr:YciI family protein [Ferruginibacter sp.]MDB5279689.1 transcription initiation protein [Ferruginibacter sp.]
MKEFLLIFRMQVDANAVPPSPEQMQASMKQWQDWLGGLAAQNKLSAAGNRLGMEGSVVKPAGVVTNGPYVEITEVIGGYSIIKADTLEEAAGLAKGCPILAVNGNVEVRQIMTM